MYHVLCWALGIQWRAKTDIVITVMKLKFYWGDLLK